VKRSSEGSVYKAVDGSGWFARLRYTDTDGRSREKKRKCLTRKQAAHRIADLRAEVGRGYSNQKTYRELDFFYRETYIHAAKFAGDHKVSGFRQDRRIIENYLDRALRHFADRDLDSITYADLADYKRRITAMPARGSQRSVSDVNHHLRYVRRLLNIAIEQGWLDRSPFKAGGALIVESIEVQRTRILSPNEERSLLAACDKFRRHLQSVIIFAIETGLRRGELQSLKWSNVDFSKRLIRIDSRSFKTLRSRLVPLTARAAVTLAKLRQNSGNGQTVPVFGPSDFKKAFNHACDEAGLSDVHFHDLRHTAITRMLEKGISPPLVMKISGHTQMKTFMRYVNQTEESIFAIAQKLDKAA